MPYQKTTFDIFKKNLKDGKYANATAAKRALGRVQLFSEEDKAAARAAADKHFGGGKAATKKVAKAEPITTTSEGQKLVQVKRRSKTAAPVIAEA